MKTRTQNRNEPVKEILKGLAVGGIIVASFVLPGLPQILTLFQANNGSRRYRLQRAIDNLQKKKFIRIEKKNGKDVFMITERGNWRVRKYAVHELTIVPSKKWDGQWRVIVFDVPERYKQARNAMSAKLKAMGCYPLQKSVFVSPYECKDEIEFITNFFGVQRFVNYMLVKKITEDKKLKLHFSIT